MLHGTLEEYGSSQGEDITGTTHRTAFIVSTIELVQGRAAEVHGSHRVTDKRVDAGIAGLSITSTLSEMQVLAGQHGLTGCIVGIHALPASWQGTTVEDHQQPEVIGINQDILIQLHHLLFVATEEIHLDTTDASTLHPCHLLTAHQMVVHLTDRTLWSIVPGTVGVIPKEQSYATFLSVAGQFLYTIIADLLIP